MADILQRAKERYNQARDGFAETRRRMIEDLRFSNPADPQQWDERVKSIRENSAEGARPCLTFDQTNQYIAQVVNDSRQNKPAIMAMPVDDKADPDVANTLDGMIRHIEYASRASIAYDTAQEYAARIGLGWLRVVPEIVDPETNLQEVRIKRVHDPLTVLLDADSTEPDGSDAKEGFITSIVSKAEHEARWPGKPVQSWDNSTLLSKDSVVICEYFQLQEASKNMIRYLDENGEECADGEEEYWAKVQESGIKYEQLGAYTAKTITQKWSFLNGAGELESTEFPAKFIPLIPVYGYEIWIEGKRYICGLTRRMMDAQRSYNYERSAYIEQVALQPKAPFIAAWESIENFEGEWQGANVGNKAYLPFNARDENGEPLPTPQRQSPPAIPSAFAQGSQLALNDIQASIGMYRANLGAPSNETSGRAINARKLEGDTANFHYIDNLARSMEQLGRIIVGMIPVVYDTKRIAKIMGINGDTEMVTIDPKQSEAVVKDGKKVKSINPNVGTYDVRVKVGPSYTTLREESAANLGELLKTNPQLVPVLGPMWARMQDWPESEKVSKMLLALAPPQVQQIEQGESDVPPEVQAQMQQMQEQIQQMRQMLEQAAATVDELEGKQAIEAQKLEIEAYKAETERMSAVAPAMNAEQIQALVMQTLQEVLAPHHAPPTFDEMAQYEQAPIEQGIEQPPPDQQMMPEQPPEGGFFMPE